MHIMQPPPRASIMAIAAHPDDIESWCAGTLARAIDSSATVRLLLVTSGECGSADLQATREQVARCREREARAAAQQLGISDVAFLHYPDGDVENTHALRSDLVAWIRRWRPTVLFTHDPEHPSPLYITHRDHRVVGRAALDAVYPLARDHLSFPEHTRAGLAPHAVESVWLFASACADVAIDITTTFERKVEARLAHVSQTVDPAALITNWRERAARIGAPLGLDAAEAFTVLQLEA